MRTIGPTPSPSGSNAGSLIFRFPEIGGPDGSFEGFESICGRLTSKWVPGMQRLLSTFPDGWPGRGLLLLRFTVAAPLFYWGVRDFVASADAGTFVCDALAAICGIFLIAGLWTPVAAIVLSLDESWMAFSHPFVPQGHLMVAAIALSLAMLGPGAWSIDSRLFGRKVLEIADDDS